MSETRTSTKFLRRILEEEGDHPEDYDRVPSTGERQHGSQAFSLQTEHLDGRRSEGFPWSHYGGNRWTDDGDQETLTLLFGARALVITGLNLKVLLPHIREGQLNGIRELSTSQRKQLEEMNPENLALVASIRVYPEFDDILKEIQGEADEHYDKHARRAQR